MPALLIVFATMSGADPVLTAASAMPVAVAPARIDGRNVASHLGSLLNIYYVVEEARPKFAAVIAASSLAGKYDVTDPELLAQRLQEDLRKVTADKHLSVLYDPARSAQLAAPRPEASAGEPDFNAGEIAAADRLNHGLAQLRVLPGNIRYLETTGFAWVGKASERAYDNAMQFLAGGDAIIIDMRGNGGGSVAAVRTLVSPFLPTNKPLMTFHLTTEGPTTSVTPSTRHGPSLVGKPLYVLTGPGSASAAEEFIGHIQGYKLGELIGETTAGAGFRNDYFTLPDGFYVSISIGQAILASTNKGWEAVGLIPDTPVPVDQALEVAQAHALKRLAANAKPAERRIYEVQAALLLARVNPVKTALPMTGYAGTYGERIVTVAGDGIVIQREGGPKSKLVAIGPNVFTYENDPGSTLTFDVDGSRATAIHLVRGDGSTAGGKRAD
ncbi:MAG: S41 family peptidase [Sphingomicrobium sp.]